MFQWMDETQCLISCQEPVLALHTLQVEHQLRRWHPHSATNSVHGHELWPDGSGGNW
jgi:hypothetical protein